MQKVKDGRITLTHLSDIIRVNLIRDYGGLWLDSTIFVMEDIPQEIFNYPLWTARFQNFRSVIVRGRWTGFLIGGDKGYILFDVLTKMLFSYWRTHDYQVDYLLIDYFIKRCYDTITQVRDQLNALPLYCGDLIEMMKKRSTGLDLKKLTGLFYKCSYKDAVLAFATGGVTVCMRMCS